MSHINTVKNRLESIFLRDRGNLDEKMAALAKDELARALGKFFILSAFTADFSPAENGGVQIVMRATGRRLHAEKD